MSLSFMTAVTVARGRDLDMILMMRDACLNEANATSEIQFQMLVTLAASIGGWRAQIKEFDFYFKNVQAFVEPTNDTDLAN